MRHKSVICIDCSKILRAPLFSPVKRCKTCAKKHRLKQIKFWKKTNKDKIRIYNRDYYLRRERYYIKKPELGTVKPNDMKITQGHVNGYSRLMKLIAEKQ